MRFTVRMAWFRKDGTDRGAAASETEVHPLQQQVDATVSSSGLRPEPGAPPPGTPETNVGLERALADRQALIQMCLYALDRARSGGVVERLEEGLAAIGVEALRPDGQRFDPARHEAGGAIPTEDPALEGIVAETEVTGFADHDRLLRAPIVTVYAKKTT